MRVTNAPTRKVCAFLSHVSVFDPVMSVVGDSSEADGPVNDANPEIVTFGIPSSYRPPLYTWGKVNPYVSRRHASPYGGMRWPFHEAFALNSFRRSRRTIQE